MAVITSAIDRSSPQFEANEAHHRSLRDELRELTGRIVLGGDERSRERHVSRGKLLPRERVNRLLDPGSPFLEVGQLGGHELYDDWIPGGGIITGVGRFSGQPCVIVANDVENRLHRQAGGL